ncbi:MAG TPA: hypothetical protein VHM90_11790 [Phycisphaerae bacterium]|nr:hypothetical protein [Phycisphaerae bacterium]
MRPTKVDIPDAHTPANHDQSNAFLLGILLCGVVLLLLGCLSNGFWIEGIVATAGIWGFHTWRSA